jgi:muconate cycloisomerase
MIRRLEAFDIFFAEQPVPPRDPWAMAQVRRRIHVPVLADESVYSAADALTLIRCESADAFSIYVGKSGGIGPARNIAAIAHAAGIPCTIGSNLEMGIASAAMAHLGLAAPGVQPDSFPCDIIGPFYYGEDIVTEPITAQGGWVRPSEKPGLGVELNEDAVARYRIDR